ncbi:hypothetical protein Fmac_016603 [Flemingia macrophylla]|uniref:25S rRNA (uridine-N(3))-methyltransferase BMT5-like domain-containing protein n=1 Tax=Flemingia macrophylla TaxID=520843 RepID=A0ABD1MK14_9FABA
MDVKSISHYRSSQKILLVGEGDFSFSLCLARAFGTAVNVVATSLDSKVSLALNYKNALSNLSELETLGCTIVHDVDVHTMAEHPLLKHQHFDCIIYNFPHAGFISRESDAFMIRLHQNLVSGFFQNAKRLLSTFGRIHITHKTSYPFSQWNIKALASCEGLELDKEVNFNIYDYPGYNNKRGSGIQCDQSFPVGKCSTFLFSINFAVQQF